MPRTEAWWICTKCRKKMCKVGKKVMAGHAQHLKECSSLGPTYRIEQIAQKKK